MTGDTIAAISSAAGPAARMILRLSGPQAIAIAEKLADRLPAPGCAMRCVLHFRGLSFPAWIYLFRAPRSYNGEDLVEFHIPGSPVLASILLEELLRLGARAAESGEFTALAYFNGRIDLTEAEGVAATIAANSEQELSAARKLLSGELARRISPIVDLIADTLALLEVGIDFSDEDVTFLPPQQLAQRINDCLAQLDHLLRESTRFERLAHEPTVVLVGRPNAGKSTLLNALAGHQRAVVSPIAGTTRDVLSVEIPLRRGTIRLTDVAGLEAPEKEAPEKGISPFSRGAVDADFPQKTREITPLKKGISPIFSEAARIERLMREHALRAVETADVVLAVIDATEDRPPLELQRPTHWIVRTKVDLRSNPSPTAQGETAVSAVTFAGLDELREVIDRLAFGENSGGAALALNARHVRAINEAIAALQRASAIDPSDAELLAVELREALDALGSIVGRISPDDLLGRIFGAFCIGK